jgi:hypothetical protein
LSTDGSNHTCAITDGKPRFRAFCWGLNEFGELGIGTYGVNALVPTEVLDPLIP